MATLRLTENGKEFAVNYSLLLVIARYLPDDKQYVELARAMIDLGIPSITEELLGKDDILDQEQRDALWAFADVELRRGMLHGDFIACLTDEQAQDIIDMNDSEMLVRVAQWAEDLFPEEVEDDEDDESEHETNTRISKGMADKLLGYITSHSDISVRRAYIENWHAPKKYMPDFEELIKIGGRHCRLVTFSEKDLPLLTRVDRDLLSQIAENLEDITDETIGRKVVQFLASYPDPAVRMAVVEYCNTPEYALEELLDDPEPDVAAIARRRIS